MNDTFGDRLRTAIAASGKTQGDIARNIGSDGAYISNLCSGRKSPALMVTRRLLNALPGVDARWLVCGGKRAKS